MPQRSGAAKRYAEAAAGLARQDASWDTWRQDLLLLSQAGEADALVCAKLDRATRRQRGLLDLLDLAEAHGFALVLLDVDLDTSTPIGRAILGILSVVAELEREQTRQRTKAALAAKRARG